MLVRILTEDALVELGYQVAASAGLRASDLDSYSAACADEGQQ